MTETGTERLQQLGSEWQAVRDQSKAQSKNPQRAFQDGGIGKWEIPPVTLYESDRDLISPEFYERINQHNLECKTLLKKEISSILRHADNRENSLYASLFERDSTKISEYFLENIEASFPLLDKKSTRIFTLLNEEQLMPIFEKVEQSQVLNAADKEKIFELILEGIVKQSSTQNRDMSTLNERALSACIAAADQGPTGELQEAILVPPLSIALNTRQ